MKLSSTSNLGRRRGRLPSPNAGVRECQREKYIGVAERVMIEEIACPGAEVAHVESPAAKRDCQAEFALLIALAMQRREALVAARSHTLIAYQRGVIHCDQRRILIVATVESAQYPAQAWNLNGG